MKTTSRLVVTGFASLLVVGICSHVNADEEVRFHRDVGTVFLNCSDVAKVLDYEFKLVTPQRLATFCRSGAQEICLPVRLTSENHRIVSEDVLVSAEVLAAALRFSVIDGGDSATIKKLANSDPNDMQNDVPAYNADWPSGRGFREGDTLPDIPLVDLNGDEVRFSQYLGQRYILYCWASW